jgi:hypothetical protein
MARQASFPLKKPLALGAIVLGLCAGSYGIAAAASGSSSSSATTDATAAATTTPTTAPTPDADGQHGAPPGATAQNPWGNQRSDETLLTDGALTKVRAAALAKVGSDATIVRVETDADGHAAYEAHMLKSDGTPVTVYVDKSFNVVSVETR